MTGTMAGLSQYGLGSNYNFKRRAAEVGAQIEEVYNGLCEKPIEEVQRFLDLNKESYSLLSELLSGIFSLKPTKTKINIMAADKVLEERTES